MKHRASVSTRIAKAADVVAVAAPLLIYFLTLPPGLTWAHDGADGGDLTAAASTWGIPHPPGYPLYTIVARAFLAIHWGTPAHRVALLSAVAGAGAAWALYRLCMALVGRPRWPIALAASLVWAFATIPWGQAVIAEVYALAGLLTIGFLVSAVRWRTTGGKWAWRAAWLLFGLGMAHHPLIAACLIPTGLWVWEQRSRLSGRRWTEAAALAAMGLCFYVYLPLRAAASPPINWGNPCTLSGFWWMVSAAPYRHFVFGLPLVEWPARFSALAGMLTSQFKVWGIALGLWGALALHERDRNASWGLLGLFAVISVYAIGYNTTDSYVYVLPALSVFAAWIAMGLADIWERVAAVRESAPRAMLAGAAAVLLALPAASLGMNWTASDLSRDHEAQDYVDESLAALPADAVVLADGDRQTFALWYARWAVSSPFRGDIISLPLLQFEWYRAQVQGRNPGLTLPPADSQDAVFVSQFIAANLDEHTLFLTADTYAVGDAFALQPAGPLLKVQKK
jgi:hypothetical protein